MAVKDIQLDTDNDLKFVNGDFGVAESDQQHIEDIIEAFVGHYKETPNIGVGVKNYLNSSGKEQELAQLIILNLQQDGYMVNRPSITYDSDGILQIDPQAVRI